MFDIYVWAAPRDLDADAAAELIATWEAGGGDPAHAPFEPSTDIGWFHRELMKDLPGTGSSSFAGFSARTASTSAWWARSTASSVACQLPSVGAGGAGQSSSAA